MNNGINYISAGAGFLNHQQHFNFLLEISWIGDNAFSTRNSTTNSLWAVFDLMYNPDPPCMEYLPTFGLNVWYINVWYIKRRYIPYIEHLAKLNRIEFCCFSKKTARIICSTCCFQELGAV